MKVKCELPLSSQISSETSVWLLSFLAGFIAFTGAILLQWLIYDDWLHRSGPLRLVGSFVACALTFVFVYRWQMIVRKRKLEMLRRFERIRWMNDRIRNSLQAIECLVYATNPQVTDSVRAAVDAIEVVLREVLVEAQPSRLDFDSSISLDSSASGLTAGRKFN